MSAVLLAAGDPGFFAPVQGDAIDALIGQYQKARANLERVSAFMESEEMASATDYFFQAHRQEFHRGTPNIAGLFDLGRGCKALDAAFWKRALDLTDVIDYMPDERRREWFNQIHEHECPPFDEATVRDNIGLLMAQRMDFLSEMVDGIFRGLSGDHVTNRPEGFSKRMIVDYCYTEFGTSGRKQGLIQDLRAVVAKFMGRDHPRYGATTESMRYFRRFTGEWHLMDGGAFKVRVYKKGTAHIEVHPQIAWRLNEILAHRHPSAIPPAHRQRPKRAPRAVTLFERPIPFAVLEALSAGKFYAQRTNIHEKNTFSLSFASTKDSHVKKAVGEILEALGGVKNEAGFFCFEYDATDAIGEVIASGMIPDQESYQYYPTPEEIARDVVSLAEIGPDHRCLEPSAGQGAIASLMPIDQTVCVEASALHCEVLRKKGLTTRCADFIGFVGCSFDRICMNPPFSQGRAQAHVEHAASMLAPGGRLVAVLPASFTGKNVLPGLSLRWSDIYRNRFTGASVDVVILTADRPA